MKTLLFGAVHQNGILLPLKYFNLIHIIMCIVPIALFSILEKLLKNKTDKQKEKILLAIAFVNILLFVAYKIAMAVMYKPFIVWEHLPLQLCNINLILIPIALKTRNKLLCNYLYYMSIWGAYAAVAVFDTYFLGRSSVSFIVVAYFVYHGIIAVTPILMAKEGLFSPEKQMISKSIFLLLGFGLAMLCVNLFFRSTGICPNANYFYTMGMEGNPILGKLMEIIPIPFLYSLPLMPVIYLFDLAIYMPFKKEKRKINYV